MSKGQVLTWTTYDTLLLALLMDKRVDEAESVWNTVIQTHTRSVPKRLFSRMILIYDIHQRPDKVLEVYLTLAPAIHSKGFCTLNIEDRGEARIQI
jgi:hypothetical protein